MSACAVSIKPFTAAAYGATLRAMRAFTAARAPETADEIWLVEHPPVFTQGLAGKPEHVLDAGNIPVVQTERGGQVTYHGPGQVVAYLLIDLRRRRLGPRALVSLIERAVVDLLGTQGVAATPSPGAPGVYVRNADGSCGAKIASLGLKVSRGCSYHGVALNVDMDLEPFGRINPCGFPGQPMTDLVRELPLDFIRPSGYVAQIAELFGKTLASSLKDSPRP